VKNIALVLLVAATAAAAAGCRTAAPPAAAPPTAAPAPPAIVQPGAPGQPSAVVSAAKATDLSKVGVTKADVAFMTGMIGHHAQALEMVALIPSRTSRADMKMLGLKIQVSQEDEIRMMQEWLTERHLPLPDPHAHHVHGATLMPGMLTMEEMATLTAATGVEFDKLFLVGMIKHHGGALDMVKDLFATPGAGQDGGMYAFASDVVADQQMEIDRMGALLRELQK